jgi:hypothetical protein
MRRRKAGGNHDGEAKPVNAEQRGRLQHRFRPGPAVPDQVPRKPGQNMAADPLARCPGQCE